MTSAFDPYHRWLAISPSDQPPDHYRLLGIDRLEGDPDVIQNAADRQMRHVRTYQLGEHAASAQRLLNEISRAKLCLLDPSAKLEYDQGLRAAEEVVVESPAMPPPVAPPVVPPQHSPRNSSACEHRNRPARTSDTKSAAGDSPGGWDFILGSSVVDLVRRFFVHRTV